GQNYVGSIDDKKSTSDYIFHHGYGPILWISKKKIVVSLSSTEVEYRSSKGVMCEVIWLRHILANMGIPEENPPIIHWENK
ncbi:hypothetical protein KI387_035188, partial [Taxus chinensis]